MLYCTSTCWYFTEQWRACGLTAYFRSAPLSLCDLKYPRNLASKFQVNVVKYRKARCTETFTKVNLNQVNSHCCAVHIIIKYYDFMLSVGGMIIPGQVLSYLATSYINEGGVIGGQ